MLNRGIPDWRFMANVSIRFEMCLIYVSLLLDGGVNRLSKSSAAIRIDAWIFCGECSPTGDCCGWFSASRAARPQSEDYNTRRTYAGYRTCSATCWGYPGALRSKQHQQQIWVNFFFLFTHMTRVIFAKVPLMTACCLWIKINILIVTVHKRLFFF